jgi:hypothetical protein
MPSPSKSPYTDTAAWSPCLDPYYGCADFKWQ